MSFPVRSMPILAGQAYTTVTIGGDSAVAVIRSLVDATIYGSRGTGP